MNGKTLVRRIIVACFATALVVGVLVATGCACSSDGAGGSSSASASSASASSASASASSSSSSASASSASSASSSSASASSSSAVSVPNVVSLTQKEAEKAITDAGLKLGVVKHESSDTVAKGNVVSQDPKAQTAAKTGDSVDLVVSTGKAEAREVQVPDLKGLTQVDAEKALSAVKLVGVASNPEESTEVAPGQVFKQSIAAGSTAKEGDKVAFTVALAPSDVEMPDVVGKTREEAKQAITDAKLGFDYTTAYNDSVAEDHVISQSVAAGAKVRTGSTVSVVVSLGVKPASDVAVPDLITYTWEEAQASLESAGLKAAKTGDEGGTVVAQDVVAGTMVAPGTTVTVTLHKEPESNPVLNFVGTYASGRPSIDVGAEGDTDATFTVHWSSSAAEYSTWTMSGAFDPDTLTVKYTNGKRVDTTQDESGKVTDETVYTNGTGTITFSDQGGLSLKWVDDKEHAADDMTFTYAL